MALKIKKFEKMIRGGPVNEQESHEKETINKIRLNELEYLKQRIFVNSLNHVQDDVLREKCLNIINHYRLFKDNESYFKVMELSVDEKDKLDKCIRNCIEKECTDIINEKESIAPDLLQLIKYETDAPNILKQKLNDLFSLLNTYNNNNEKINNSIFKLLDSNYINIIEAQQLVKQVDVIKDNSYKLQSDIVNKFSCSENLLESLEKYLNIKESEYATNLAELEDLQKIQSKYDEVDGPQYRSLVKQFVQIKEIIKIKTEMFNN